MKQLKVKRLECQQVKAADIPALFKANGVSYNKIDTVDWQQNSLIVHRLSLLLLIKAMPFCCIIELKKTACVLKLAAT